MNGGHVPTLAAAAHAAAQALFAPTVSSMQKPQSRLTRHQQAEPPTGMHPEEIKAAMRMQGITPSALADELGVASSTVSQVISGRTVSERVAARIASIIGKPASVIWLPRQHLNRRAKASKAAASAPHATKETV